MTRPELYVRAAACCHVGRVRPANEDAYVALALDGSDAVTNTSEQRLGIGAHGVLLAVSDGMGGARDGAVASRITIDALVASLRRPPPELDGAPLLEHAARDAHLAVWDASCRAGHHGHTRMGSTLTAALVRNGRVFVAQVGDSRAYLLRRGEMTRLTSDQTMVQSLVDKGMLAPKEAERSPFRSILTQAVGHQENVEIAMSDIELFDRDCLLLCSDGLTGEISDDEIRDIVLTSMRLDVAVKRLVDRANEHGGRDNVTVVLGGIGRTTVPPASA